MGHALPEVLEPTSASISSTLRAMRSRGHFFTRRL
jgi:hypothetical protein